MRTKIILGVLGLVALGALVLPAGDAEAQSVLPPTTLPCTSLAVACHGGTSVCSGSIPDAGSATGIVAAQARSYYVYSCPHVGAAMTAAGTYRNYHCHAGTGKCAEVASNRQTVSTALTVGQGATAGEGTGAPLCWESGPFSVPYFDNTGDTITWIPQGIVLDVSDGGSLTTYICPAS